MNTQQPTGATASLPHLSDERIAAIEESLFTEIADDRVARHAKSARRGRMWMAGGAAAAVIAVAAIIAPSVVPLVSGGATNESSAVAPEFAPDLSTGTTADSPVTDDAGGARSDAGGASSLAAEESTGDRDIITSASATVSVDDVSVAARTIGNAAVAREGYVESMSVGSNGQVIPMDTGGVVDRSATYPYTPDGAWVTVRVPSEQLSGLVEELSDVGEVTASSVNRQDVTEQTVDLTARITAAQASVDRLVDLMGQAENVADLIAAEAALSERQALLESYQQQLEMIEDQVAMSSLSVTLTPDIETVTADPAGFGDGLAAGWNGLVATLNGIVVALGFLLPWLIVAVVAGLVVWAVVRLARRRNTETRDGAKRTDAAPTPPAAGSDASS